MSHRSLVSSRELGLCFVSSTFTFSITSPVISIYITLNEFTITHYMKGHSTSQYVQDDSLYMYVQNVQLSAWSAYTKIAGY